MPEVCDGIRARLFLLADPAYRAFQQPLIPTVPPERVIGVRTPALRALARELAGTSAAETFRADLPHRYFEENQLHAFLIERIRHFGETVAALEAFLPYVDNWATCDQMRPPALGQDGAALAIRCRAWLASGRVYTVRFGLVTLMRYFLGAGKSAFPPDPEVPALAVAAAGEDYYTRMAAAWLFAEGLTWQYELFLPWLTDCRLPPELHRMTVRKALDSYRVPAERKAVIRRTWTVRTQAAERT